MNTPNDGGPIAADMTHQQRGQGPDHEYVQETVLFAKGGLSIRDWFAGMAMQGYLAGRNINALDCSFYTAGTVADNCYGYADAMLAARAGKESA